MPERTDCDQLRPPSISDEISTAYPNLSQTIWLLVLFLFVQVGLAVPVVIADEWRLEDDFLLGILSLVNFAIILGYLYRRTDLDWEFVRRLFNRDFDLRVWPCVAISVVGLGMLDTELMKVVIRIVPMPEWIQEVYRSQFLSRTSFLSALFGAVLVAPLGEELMFRGIILSGLLANYTRIYAIAWSAVLFGMLHLDLWQLVPIILSGLVWAWWVIRTGSLLPALFGHALKNLIAVTILHSYTRHLDLSGDINEVGFNPWWWSVSGVALPALGLWWFYRISNYAQHITQGQDPPADAETDAI